MATSYQSVSTPVTLTNQTYPTGGTVSAGQYMGFGAFTYATAVRGALTITSQAVSTPVSITNQPVS